MFRAIFTSLLLTATVLPAHAQEGVSTYPASFFQENQPATALDMVRLLPGFRLQSGDSGIRGFSGTVGNVLIDGRIQAIAGDEDLHIVQSTQCVYQWQEEINTLLPAHQTTGSYYDRSMRCRYN